MKIFRIVVLVVLIAMSLSAGAAKVMQMPQEVQFFEAAGLNVHLLMALGALQIIGGVLAAFPDFRKSGAIIIGVGFLVSSFAIFMTGDIAFGAFSLLPVALAGFLVTGGGKA